MCPANFFISERTNFLVDMKQYLYFRGILYNKKDVPTQTQEYGIYEKTDQIWGGCPVYALVETNTNGWTRMLCYNADIQPIQPLSGEADSLEDFKQKYSIDIFTYNL